MDRALDKLEGVYESDGALWLRTTAAGDDKDRVLRRSTGELAYFAPGHRLRLPTSSRAGTTG